VIEKSSGPSTIGIILLIENCSNGEKKDIKKKKNEKSRYDPKRLLCFPLFQTIKSQERLLRYQV
jgi:hypothetical protein